MHGRRRLDHVPSRRDIPARHGPSLGGCRGGGAAPDRGTPRRHRDVEAQRGDAPRGASPVSAEAVPGQRRRAGHAARFPVHALSVVEAGVPDVRGIPAQVLQARVQTCGAGVGFGARHVLVAAEGRFTGCDIEDVHDGRVHVDVLLPVLCAQGRRGAGGPGR